MSIKRSSPPPLSPFSPPPPVPSPSPPPSPSPSPSLIHHHHQYYQHQPHHHHPLHRHHHLTSISTTDITSTTFTLTLTTKRICLTSQRPSIFKVAGNERGGLYSSQRSTDHGFRATALFLLFMCFFLGVLVRHCAGVIAWPLPLPTPPALMLVTHMIQVSGSAVALGLWGPAPSLAGLQGVGPPGC